MIGQLSRANENSILEKIIYISLASSFSRSSNTKEIPLSDFTATLTYHFPPIIIILFAK